MAATPGFSQDNLLEGGDVIKYEFGRVATRIVLLYSEQISSYSSQRFPKPCFNVVNFYENNSLGK